MNDKIPARRKALVAFVALKHATQRRKYTNEPYFNHLRNVAETVEPLFPLAYEIGLCHDILEDFQFTEVLSPTLYDELKRCGYTALESATIVHSVVDLTDVYTSEACPDVNRRTRKFLEANRLHGICAESQTVKYADLIDNTSSIVKYDPDFAKIYLEEKQEILKGMSKGDPVLYSKALFTLRKAKETLRESGLYLPKQ